MVGISRVDLRLVWAAYTQHVLLFMSTAIRTSSATIVVKEIWLQYKMYNLTVAQFSGPLSVAYFFLYFFLFSSAPVYVVEHASSSLG